MGPVCFCCGRSDIPVQIGSVETGLKAHIVISLRMNNSGIMRNEAFMQRNIDGVLTGQGYIGFCTCFDSRFAIGLQASARASHQ